MTEQTSEVLQTFEDNNRPKWVSWIARRIGRRAVDAEPSEVKHASLPEGYHFTDSSTITPEEEVALINSVNIGKGYKVERVKERKEFARITGNTIINVGVRNDDGRLVGFGSVVCSGDKGELCDFVVDPADQHKGIGRAIIVERLAIAENAGVTSFFIPRLEKTNTLGPFYEELGFHTNRAGDLERGPHPAEVIDPVVVSLLFTQDV